VRKGPSPDNQMGVQLGVQLAPVDLFCAGVDRFEDPCKTANRYITLRTNKGGRVKLDDILSISVYSLLASIANK
jgi:hypothetical protein